MANGQGGYRQPSNPAPVSGPGQHSRRTDGQPAQRLPDAKYGEQQAFQQAQQGAPMSQATTPAQVVDSSRVVPFTEGTQRPEEPITAGVDRRMPNLSEDDLIRLRSYIRPLKFLASLPGASSSTRQLVRQLQGAVS